MCARRTERRRVCVWLQRWVHAAARQGLQSPSCTCVVVRLSMTQACAQQRRPVAVSAAMATQEAAAPAPAPASGSKVCFRVRQGGRVGTHDGAVCLAHGGGSASHRAQGQLQQPCLTPVHLAASCWRACVSPLTSPPPWPPRHQHRRDRSRCALRPRPLATCTLAARAQRSSTGCTRARRAARLCSGACARVVRKDALCACACVVCACAWLAGAAAAAAAACGGGG